MQYFVIDFLNIFKDEHNLSIQNTTYLHKKLFTLIMQHSAQLVGCKVMWHLSQVVWDLWLRCRLHGQMDLVRENPQILLRGCREEARVNLITNHKFHLPTSLRATTHVVFVVGILWNFLIMWTPQTCEHFKTCGLKNSNYKTSEMPFIKHLQIVSPIECEHLLMWTALNMNTSYVNTSKMRTPSTAAVNTS